MNQLINIWITCLRISGNVLEDAANTFRLEYTKFINPDPKHALALKSANILKNLTQKQKQNRKESS